MIEELRQKAARLPMRPGVYIMLDKSSEVIYVGKAKALKSRVSSYFRESGHDAKTIVLVSKIADFNVIVADTELEALVLENSLIKRHMPRYNILLKDSKGYPFIRLDTNSQYPRFTIVSKREDDGARYFGPYGGRSTTREAIETVCRALMLPTCSKKFPRDIGKSRPCLNKHMGICRGYCQEDSDAEEYRSSINEAAMILEGDISGLVKRLTAEMETAAEELRFELAARKRDKIKAVSLLETKQRIISGAMADTDVIGFYRGEDKSCFVVLHYIGGTLLDKDYMLFEEPIETDSEAVSGLLRRYYSGRGAYPKLILLPIETQDEELISELFTKENGRKVEVAVPMRGEKKKLIENANLNAREESLRAEDREKKTAKSLEWLRKTLNLPEMPKRIEAFDISNTAGSDTVASMVVFKDGKPLKRAYRKFKINTVKGQDDYASMREALKRRFLRLLENDEKFSEPPQLLLVDGGMGHVSAAISVLRELSVDIPVFGMVKDQNHKTRALVSKDGSEIGIEASPAVFALIGSIQEETHRFAIEYHRSLRSKSVRKSVLDGITGIGESRKKALLKHFGSIKAIKAATQDEIAAVIPANAAKAVYGSLHGEEDKK